MADLDDAFLISLFNKEPYTELVKLLDKKGCSFIASSGTARWLAKLGIEAQTVEEVFGLAERLAGKVKTLQPDIYSSIMATNGEEPGGDFPLLNGVCIDLTPPSAGGEDDSFEKVDIGGVGLVRAAAKSWRQVTVVSSPPAAEYLCNNFPPGGDERRQLAVRAIKQTLKYDKQFLSMLQKFRSPLAERLSLEEVEKLRYGENPAQGGYIGADLFSEDKLPFEQLAGPGLSYTNCLDLDAARRLVKDTRRGEAVVIKHTNPTGWGAASNLNGAFEKAWAGDPKSAYGGFAAFNRPVDQSVARPVLDKFLEGVVAPGFSSEALEILKERERLRVIQWPGMFEQQPGELIRNFGEDLYLCQDELTEEIYNSGWEVVSERQPSNEEKETLGQAWRICRHVNSNAAVMAVRDQLLAAGVGQQSRVDAVELAVKKYKQYHGNKSSPVLASDGFFPFADNIEVAAEAGVQAIVAPGGSIRDEEVIREADKQEMALIFAGERIFYH